MDANLLKHLEATIERQAAELAALRAENFALAAGQCVNATADEGGRPYCKEIEALRAERDALRADVDNRRQDWERWVWLRDWLVRYGLLHYEECQPEAKMQCGRYWIFRKPAVIDGTHVEGWATTADAAIDAARAGGGNG